MYCMSLKISMKIEGNRNSMNVLFDAFHIFIFQNYEKLAIMYMYMSTKWCKTIARVNAIGLELLG